MRSSSSATFIFEVTEMKMPIEVEIEKRRDELIAYAVGHLPIITYEG